MQEPLTSTPAAAADGVGDDDDAGRDAVVDDMLEVGERASKTSGPGSSGVGGEGNRGRGGTPNFVGADVCQRPTFVVELLGLRVCMKAASLSTQSS